MVGGQRLRIVAGTARGRLIAAPASNDQIRPTADRVRETIFNVLGQTCEGLIVADLYAGTGALGFEAISRGASRVYLIDRDRQAIDLCRHNAALLGMDDSVEIIQQTADKAIVSLKARGVTFDLVFADPPYRMKDGLRILTALEGNAVLNAGARVVIEHAEDEQLPERLTMLSLIDRREFSQTVVSTFQLT